MKIVILGSGNVATVLGSALLNGGNNIIQVWSRNAKHAKALASLLHTHFIDDIKQIDTTADLYLIAVSDDAIQDVINNTPALKGLIAHTSGSTSINILKDKFENSGVFYPFQTFSKERLIDFSNVPLLLEASNPKAMDLLKLIAASVSNTVKECNSDQRKSLHIAAVFACNFTNHLYTIAQKLLEENQLDFDLLRPLIAETAQKVQKFMPENVQTGPAVRNDMSIIDSHLKQLENHPKLLAIYSLLTEEIISASSKDRSFSMPIRSSREIDNC